MVGLHSLISLVFFQLQAEVVKVETVVIVFCNPTEDSGDRSTIAMASASML
jgi:hypothetical protein